MTLDAEVRAESDEMTRMLAWLATIGAVAPLLGLLGTVLGIMQSFLGIADSIVLCNQVENSVFVIESGKTRKGQAKAALKRLQQAGVHPLGVILTKIDAYHDLYGYHSYYYQYASAEPAAARKEVAGA